MKIAKCDWNVANKVFAFDCHCPRFSNIKFSSFWWRTICKNRLGKAGSIYHMNDINFYLSRHLGVGGEVEAFSCSANPNTVTVVPNIHKAKIKLPLNAQDEECVCETCYFSLVPLLPSVYLGKHWCHSLHKCLPDLPPLFLHTVSSQKLDGGRPGNEAIN